MIGKLAGALLPDPSTLVTSEGDGGAGAPLADEARDPSQVAAELWEQTEAAAEAQLPMASESSGLAGGEVAAHAAPRLPQVAAELREQTEAAADAPLSWDSDAESSSSSSALPSMEGGSPAGQAALPVPEAQEAEAAAEPTEVGEAVAEPTALIEAAEGLPGLETEQAGPSPGGLLNPRGSAGQDVAAGRARSAEGAGGAQAPRAAGAEWRLRLVAGAAGLPHPDKADRGGEVGAHTPV